MSGPVISGFGRGSKELGIPTANLPVDASLTPWITDIPSGVYFGWAALHLDPSHPDYPSTHKLHNGFAVYPMVMSLGYNPFYKNTVRSAEVHILHKFSADFYGRPLRLLITGFVREERDYASLEALVEDILFDCRVARASLARRGWRLKGVSLAVEVKGEGVDGDEKEEEEEGALDGEWLVRQLDEGELEAGEKWRKEEEEKEKQEGENQ